MEDFTKVGPAVQLWPYQQGAQPRYQPSLQASRQRSRTTNLTTSSHSLCTWSVNFCLWRRIQLIQSCLSNYHRASLCYIRCDPSLQPLSPHVTCLFVCVCLCLCLCHCCFVAVFARLCWFLSNSPSFLYAAAMWLVFVFVFVSVFLFYSVFVFSWLCCAQSGPPLQPLGRHVTLSLGSRLVRCKQFFTPARSIPNCLDVIRMLTSLHFQSYALESWVCKLTVWPEKLVISKNKTPQNHLFWWTRIWVTWLWKANSWHHVTFRPTPDDGSNYIACGRSVASKLSAHLCATFFSPRDTETGEKVIFWVKPSIPEYLSWLPTLGVV